MGRSIDEDKLYDDLADKLKWLMGYGDDVYLSVGDDIRCAVANQPTAYYPDKVVAQLEDEVKKYDKRIERRNGDCYFDETEKIKALEERARGIEKAIEIVKGDREPEPECEWKLEDSESNLYVTGCENLQLIFYGTPEENGYKYCPYCGRKIKRGGVDGN